MSAALARVLDPGELENAPAPRGHLQVDVVASWLADAADVQIIVPARLTCARCAGGDCDGCSRNGALQLTGDDNARTLRLALPRGERNVCAKPLLVRLVRPLDDEPAPAQLWVELRPSVAASTFCRRVATAAPPPSRGPRRLTLAVGGLVALLAALVTARFPFRHHLLRRQAIVDAPGIFGDSILPRKERRRARRRRSKEMAIADTPSSPKLGKDVPVRYRGQSASRTAHGSSASGAIGAGAARGRDERGRAADRFRSGASAPS